MDNYIFDVAISFAGEQRKYAERLAQRLSDCGIKAFLDYWYVENAWGKDLTSYFSSVFPKEALYVIAIFSKEYNEKEWTKFEFEIMQSRQMSEEEYILPITFDGYFPQSWPRTRGYIDANAFSIDEIALYIRGKVIDRKTQKPHKNLENNNDISSHKLMTIIDDDGKTELVEVILAFEFKNTKKEYVIYTKNEKDSYGNTTIYVSNVDRSSGSPKLYAVEDADWGKVKEVLWKLSQGDSISSLRTPLEPFFDRDGIEIL